MGNSKSSPHNVVEQELESGHALKQLLKFQAHEFLVFGYIRMFIEPLISDDNPLSQLETPLDLLQIMISYYNVGIHSHILVWCGSEERCSVEYNQHHILNIKNHKKYKLNVYDLDHGLVKCAKDIRFDRLHSGYCSISGVKLPNWVLQLPMAKHHLSRHKKYHCIFRFGGTLKYDKSEEDYKYQCDLLMMDSTKLNAITNRSSIESYFCKIPTSLLGVHHFQNFSMSFNNNFLTVIGGKRNAGNYTKSLKRLDLQTLSWDNDQFITRQMTFGRSDVTCVVMKDPSDQQQMESPLILIGGRYQGGIAREVEMYSFIKNESIQLAPMREARAHCGSVYLPIRNEVVCVGGTGRKSAVSRQIEIYNFEANKWIKCNRKCEDQHAVRPLVWNDEMNNDILYVAGNDMDNGKRHQLGTLEVMDMRQPKNWKLVDERDLISLLELRNSADIFNDWTVRRAFVI